MAIQVRRGNEVDFDPSQMLPGEWAVSLDTKYVRMCFSPGVCLRMATYEGFEADMAQIQQILSDVRTAEAAIKKIQSEVNAQAEIVDENTDLCEEYARRAENAADKAEAITDIHYATKDRAGIVAPQDIHVDEQGNMVMIAETSDSTLRNSYAGGIQVEIHGKYEQDGEPTPDYPQEIKKSVISGVKTHRKNHLDCRGLSEFVSTGFTFTPVYKDESKEELLYINVNGTWNTSSTATNVRMNLGRWYPKETGNYVLSGIMNHLGTGNMLCLDKNGDSGGYEVQATTSVEFTVTDDVEFYDVWLRIQSGMTVNNEKVYPMICKADITDATYEPYTESVATLSNPIELGGIGDVADVLYAEKIEWRFTEVVLNGSESWFANAATNSPDGGYAYRTPLASVSDGNALCSHYTKGTLGDRAIGKFRMQASFAEFWSDKPTVDEWKAQLASEFISLVYPLATPTTEELPTADQIALNSLKSFDSVTYVETDSEVKPTIHSKYGTSKVGAMALELQNENANLKLQMNNAKATEITETKVSFPAKMGTDTASGIWNVELQRPTDADYTLLGWTIINPKANVANVYVSTVDGYTLSGDIVESGAHAAFSVTIRAMWSKS